MKDHAGFLLATTELARTDPRVHICLAGLGVDARNQDLTGRIPGDVAARFHLLGERKDVPALMNAFDLLCSSSAWGEGFPNVLGEAMACGIPCVTTDVGDSREVVGDTGLVVQPADPTALASGLSASLSMPLNQRMALGRAARDRIREYFGLAHVVARYAALYSCLADSTMRAKGMKSCL
jgi:glycosyltransferase involved in cell wall biosynthesis